MVMLKEKNNLTQQNQNIMISKKEKIDNTKPFPFRKNEHHNSWKFCLVCKFLHRVLIIVSQRFRVGEGLRSSRKNLFHNLVPQMTVCIACYTLWFTAVYNTTTPVTPVETRVHIKLYDMLDFT